MKKNNNKGFTLMEMLIVVAIIAILIAIAIPTFTSSLNKARDASDEANARALYAAMMSKAMIDGTSGSVSGDKDLTYDGVVYKFNGDAEATAGDIDEIEVSVTLSTGKTVTFSAAGSTAGTSA